LNILKRFTNPSKHVLEPYGTVVQNEKQIFVQVSKDPEYADWITLGELYESVLPLTDEFFNECLSKYTDRNV
jgi:hypothetical protein